MTLGICVCYNNWKSNQLGDTHFFFKLNETSSDEYWTFELESNIRYILRLFGVLLNFSFTTSKTMRDYYL